MSCRLIEFMAARWTCEWCAIFTKRCAGVAGTLPVSWGLMRSAQTLYLNRNQGINGTLPPGWKGPASFQNLSYISCWNTSLTGAPSLHSLLQSSWSTKGPAVAWAQRGHRPPQSCCTDRTVCLYARLTAHVTPARHTRHLS